MVSDYGLPPTDRVEDLLDDYDPQTFSYVEYLHAYDSTNEGSIHDPHPMNEHDLGRVEEEAVQVNRCSYGPDQTQYDIPKVLPLQNIGVLSTFSNVCANFAPPQTPHDENTRPETRPPSISRARLSEGLFPVETSSSETRIYPMPKVKDETCYYCRLKGKRVRSKISNPVE